MATVPVKVMIDAVAHYWAPKTDYASPEAASNWSELIKAGDFTAWSRKGEGSQYPANREVVVDSTLQLHVPSMSVVTGQERVPIKLFSPAEGAAAPYLGHNPGDHVFRVDVKVRNGEVKGCLKYDGQIPRARAEYQQRLETLLADVVDMAACALSFLPKVRSSPRPLIPCYLQDIRNKRGEINQADVDLLLSLWEEKFVDWDHDGAEIKIRSSVAIPQLAMKRSRETITEAAFLVNKLQLAQDPWSWEPPFEFTTLIRLLEKITDQPFTRLLRLHLDKMENEGLNMLHGLCGSRDQVLVYVNKEDIPLLDVMSGDSAANKKERRRPNKDAAEVSSKWRWGADNNPAAAPDRRPGAQTPDATEAAKAKLVRRHGWFADPLRSSTFHRFYQQQQEQQHQDHDRDFQVLRAGSASSSSTGNSIEQRASSDSPDRLVSSEQLTSHLPTPPLEGETDIQETVVLCASQPCNDPSSSRIDDKPTATSRSDRFRRPQIGDKGVAVPKNRGRGGRVEKRKQKTPKNQTVARFFL